MTTKKSNPKLVTNVSTSETLYADALTQLALGPHVSKLTFGGDAGASGTLASVVTLVLPTPALLDLVANVMKALSQKETQQQLHADLAEHIKRLQELR